MNALTSSDRVELARFSSFRMPPPVGADPAANFDFVPGVTWQHSVIHLFAFPGQLFGRGLSGQNNLGRFFTSNQSDCAHRRGEKKKSRPCGRARMSSSLRLTCSETLAAILLAIWEAAYRQNGKYGGEKSLT